MMKSNRRFYLCSAASVWLVMPTCFVALVVLMMTPDTELNAQDAIYDESKMPSFTLPDPLTFDDGRSVAKPEQWEQRRKEVLTHFKNHVFGTMPDAQGRHRVELKPTLRSLSTVDFPIDPKKPDQTVAGVLRQITLTISLPRANDSAGDGEEGDGEEGDGEEGDGEEGREPSIKLNLLVISPANASQPSPAFLAYNFGGNHTVDPHEAISLDPVWDTRKKKLVPSEAKSRGKSQRRWPVGLILSRGYSLVTLYYGDVDADYDDGFKQGAHALFPDLQNRDDNWTSIGAWAWALHRVTDFLQTDDKIDAKQVIVMGHSRLGKTSLWTGATDERFLGVISNNSGCGGAALSRRRIGESVKRINRVFPHWFCRQHRTYDDNEDACPVDHHMLIALAAPRPVYIASAEQDRWADPKGEFLSAFHAGPVYQLLGQTGLGLTEPAMPELENPIGKSVRYHIRRGKHDVTRYDWRQYLDFADFATNEN